MLAKALIAAAGAGVSNVIYSDEVFSAFVYQGNGSTQTITNGIDLAGKGGLVWGKVRSTTGGHELTDTARGANNALNSHNTDAQSTSDVTAFSSTGYTLGYVSGNENFNGRTYVSWTFRKAPKFFDVVTFTAPPSGNATVSHSLGSIPGMIIIKATSSTGAWYTYHRSIPTEYLIVNTTAAAAAFQLFPNVGIDSFEISSGGLTASATYVAYLFAHDTATDGLIQCGSYSGTSAAQTVTLGWEPQFVMVKRTDSATNNGWVMVDMARGGTSPAGTDMLYLLANSAGTGSNENIGIRATGFALDGSSSSINVSGGTYTYLAIRRPNKPPTTGTQVYNAIALTPTANLTGTKITTGFVTDMLLSCQRTRTNISDTRIFSRLQGKSAPLITNTTDAEGSFADPYNIKFDYNDGVLDNFYYPQGTVTSSVLYAAFRRAPQVFDVVCYTGTGVARTVAHSLGVVPEMMIVKRRNVASSAGWMVYHSAIGNTVRMLLNDTSVPSISSTCWNNTTPTESVFTVGGLFDVNNSADTYVAYLFATKAGISYVGSYTGNGTSQTINCGFTTGARFFLVKATSTTGSWWVYDSVRGIISSSDPALQLNSTAAEVTTADACDPDNSGIVVNEEATCAINTNGVSYICLAFS